MLYKVSFITIGGYKFNDDITFRNKYDLVNKLNKLLYQKTVIEFDYTIIKFILNNIELNYRFDSVDIDKIDDIKDNLIIIVVIINLLSNIDNNENNKKIIKSLITDIDFIIAINNFDNRLLEDDNIAKIAISNCGIMLDRVAYKFKDNEETVLDSIKCPYNIYHSFQYASYRLKNDPKFIFKAIKINGWILYYISDELKNNRNFILEVVKKNGLCIKSIKDEFRNDKEILLSAIEETEDAYEYIPYNIKNNKDFILEALKYNGLIMQFLSNEYKNNKKLNLELLDENNYTNKNNCGTLRNVHINLKHDKDFVLDAITINPESIIYCSRSLFSKDFIEEAIRRNNKVLDYYNQ